MIDSAGFAARRHRMVEELALADPEVRRAMRAVPRHAFLPGERWEEAYRDEPVSLGPSGATISAPHMVALLAEAAALRRGDRVLEAGAGMGYLAAVLAEIVGADGQVDAMEIDRALASEARRRLAAAGWGERVRVWDGDAVVGLPTAAPFDAIVVSFAVPQLYGAWKDQLLDGGRLVAPVGDAHLQRLTTFTHHRSGGRIRLGPWCRFVPQRRTPAPI